MKSNQQTKSNKRLKGLAKRSGAVVIGGALLFSGIPFSTQFVMANEGIYKATPTRAVKLNKDSFEHVYFAEVAQGVATGTGSEVSKGHANQPMVENKVKVIPLTNENENFEQEWMIIYNMGMHDDLWKHLAAFTNGVDVNDGSQLKELLKDSKLHYTANPWFSFMLSKDLKIQGDVNIYALSDRDLKYDGNRYVTNFDTIVNRVNKYDSNNPDNDPMITKAGTFDPNNKKWDLLLELPKGEKAIRYNTFSRDNFTRTDGAQAWTDFADMVLTGDNIAEENDEGFGLDTDETLEFGKVKVSSNDAINDYYKQPIKGKGPSGTNGSPTHYLINDLGQIGRFKYRTNDLFKLSRFVLKFKTVRTPEEFFRDDRYEFARRNEGDANNAEQAKPNTTFVAGAYKSFDYSHLWIKIDAAVVGDSLKDTDNDGLNDYYEKLIGTDINSDNTNGDDKKDNEEFLWKDRVHATKNIDIKANLDSGGAIDINNPNKVTKDAGHNKYMIPAEDPAVAKPKINESSVAKNLGSTVTGETTPYATVILYAADDTLIPGTLTKNPNPVGEAIADADGKFTIVVGNKIARKAKGELNSYGNDIDFQDEARKIPKYTFIDESEIGKNLKSFNKAVVGVKSEGNDGRPLFFFDTLSDPITLIDEEKKDDNKLLEEALLTFDKVEVKNPDALTEEERNIVRQSLKENPKIAPLLKPDAEDDAFMQLDKQYRIPLKTGDKTVKLNQLVEKMREIDEVTITKPYEKDTTLTFSVPQSGTPYGLNGKVPNEDRYETRFSDSYKVVVTSKDNEEKFKSEVKKLTNDDIKNGTITLNVPELAEGDTVKVSYVNKYGQELKAKEETVTVQAQSAKPSNPTKDGNKLIFELPDPENGGSYDGATAKLVDQDGKPVSPEKVGKIQKDPDTGKYQIEFDIDGIDDGTILRAELTEKDKKPTASDDFYKIDNTPVGNFDIVGELNPDDKTVKITVPDGIENNDTVKVTITRGDETKEVEVKYDDKKQSGDEYIVNIEKEDGSEVSTTLKKDEVPDPNNTEEVKQKLKDKGVITDNDKIIEVKLKDPKYDIDLGEENKLQPGDKVVVTITDKAGNSKSSAEKTVEKPKDAPVTEKPVLDAINENQPNIKIGKVDENADKITVKVGKDGEVTLTLDENGTWTVDENNKDKYDVSVVEEGEEPNKEKKVVLTPKNEETKKLLEGKEITATVTNTKDKTNKTLTSDPVTYDTTKPSKPTVTEAHTGDATVKVEIPSDVVNGDKVKVTVSNEDGEPVTKEVTVGDNNKKTEDGKTYVEVKLDTPLKKDDKVTAQVEDKAGNLSEKSDEVTVTDRENPEQPDTLPEPEVKPVGKESDSVDVKVPEGEENKITVKLPDNTEVVAEKGEDNNWKVGKSVLTPNEEGYLEIPVDNSKINGGGDIKVTTEDGKGNKSPEKTVSVDTVDPKAPEVIGGSLTEEDTTIPIKKPDDDTSKITIKLPTDPEKEIVLEKGEDGNWSGKDKEGNPVKVEEKEKDGTSYIEVTLPEGEKVPEASEDGSKKVTIVAEDPAGNKSETKVDINKKTEEEKPAKPVVDPINKDDDKVTVKVPEGENDKKIIVQLPDGTKVEVTKDEDGKWKTGEGTEIKPKEGKLEIPVDNDKIKEGGEVRVTVEDKDGNKSEETKVTINTGDKKDADKYTPNLPKNKVEVENPKELTEEEKEKVKKAVEDANKDENGKSTLPDGTKIEVDKEGNVTITYPDKSTDTIPGKDVVKEKEPETQTDAEKYEPKKPKTKVEVEDDKNLTEGEKDKVKKAVEDANKDENGKSTLPDGTKIEVGEDGTVTITYPDKSTDTIPGKDVVIGKKDADKYDPKKPKTKVEVEDDKNLTEEEKDKVKKAVEEANKDENGKSTLPEGTKIEVGEDGTVTITYPDKSTDTIPGKDVVIGKKDSDKSKLQEELNKEDEVKASDNYNNADKDKKDAYDKALEEAKEVLENPNATQKEVDEALKKLQDATDNLKERLIPYWPENTIENDPRPWNNDQVIIKPQEPKENKEEPKQEETKLHRWAKYMQGNEKGEFMPEKALTRAEAAQIIYNMLKEDKNPDQTGKTYTDVKENAWYKKAVDLTSAKRNLRRKRKR